MLPTLIDLSYTDQSRRHRSVPMIYAENETGTGVPVRIGSDLFDKLFKGCRVERYAAGQHLFVQEDDSDRIYGVISGTVEISLYSPGGQKLVANMELHHSLVGEIGALDGGSRTATAICLTPCEMVSLSRAQLFERMEGHPALARAMIELLCARLRWVSGEMGDLAFFAIEARLAKRLALLSGINAAKDGWIDISQAELAEFLGATRESVNKTLNDWRSKGVIELRRGGVRVLSASRLHQIAVGGD
jgi:CRP/FNR family cyclic AMP-dependent transcriptional regulator